MAPPQEGRCPPPHPTAGVDVIRVKGGARLDGDVTVGGAKNSALKLMAVALLAEGRSVVANVPRITDVAIMGEVLRRLGCDVVLDGGRATIEVPAEPGSEADYDLVRRLRASICVLGPLLARRGYVRVALPGGDMIGSRGLDMHVSGLARLGADISGEHGFVIASAPAGLRGSKIWLDFPSVGATENLLMAAVLAKGVTEIDNAAREPEIVDICEMLTAMGARIAGAGPSTLEIEGVDGLTPVSHTTVGDRIVGGTWAFGAAMTRGDVTVRGVRPEFLDIALDKLVTAGAGGGAGGKPLPGRMEGRPPPGGTVTLPYPGVAPHPLPTGDGPAAGRAR